MQVNLYMKVPVSVVVDLDEKTVTKVVVHDEEMERDSVRTAMIDDRIEVSPYAKKWRNVVEQAEAIAEDPATYNPNGWPAWQFGW